MTQGVNFVHFQHEMMRAAKSMSENSFQPPCRQLAQLVSPNHKQHVIASGPARSCNETMIPADDAHCTVELDDRYVILQSLPMRRAMPICIAAASRSPTDSAIPATTIPKNWTRSPSDLARHVLCLTVLTG